MASPQVAGLAGLIWANNPSFTQDDVKNTIYNTADDLDALNPIYGLEPVLPEETEEEESGSEETGEEEIILHGSGESHLLGHEACTDGDPQATGRETGRVVHGDGRLAEVGPPLARGVEGGLGGVQAANHLEQGHRGRRVEKVHSDDALARIESGAELGDRQARGVGAEQRVIRRGVANLAEHLHLQIHVLGHRLDHDVDAVGGFAQRGRGRQAVERGLAPLLEYVPEPLVREVPAGGGRHVKSYVVRLVDGADAGSDDVVVAEGRVDAVLRPGCLDALCEGHFPGDPIVPGSRLLGVMAAFASRTLSGTWYPTGCRWRGTCASDASRKRS